ncbi:hypothetical protein ACFZDK_55630 [Streptomyces sp. NPDC007901]|uniref:hypothetical protein n=1 Tax=Streptomyces sp. NPDC007901 TaxID=3364785 RepID=UPI0036E5CB67
MATYDVLVAGIRPLGAMAEITAGRVGVRTVVVENAADVCPLPRAVHFDAEIIRLQRRVPAARGMGFSRRRAASGPLTYRGSR